MRCANRPVSWLTLERYHLNELSAAEAHRVALHLASCPACAACSRAIEGDTRALPPLPEEVVSPRPGPWTGPRLALGLGALVAAVLTASLLIPEIAERPEVPPDRLSYKGGALALTVVRERRGAIVENPSRYLPGDRFRLFVTIPGTGAVEWDVALFQAGEVHFPYEARERLGPGSNIPLPGAFRLTGREPTEICVWVGARAQSRVTIKKQGRRALPVDAVCRKLTAPPLESP